MAEEVGEDEGECESGCGGSARLFAGDEMGVWGSEESGGGGGVG